MPPATVERIKVINRLGDVRDVEDHCLAVASFGRDDEYSNRLVNMFKPIVEYNTIRILET